MFAQFESCPKPRFHADRIRPSGPLPESNDWYPALAKPNVTVLFQGLHHITENGVVGDDGVEIPVDAIIFGTGYAVAEPAIYRIIKGADGRSLSEHWQGCPRA